MFISFIGGASDIKILWIINKLAEKLIPKIYIQKLMNYSDSVTISPDYKYQTVKNMQFSIETIKRLSNKKSHINFMIEKKLPYSLQKANWKKRLSKLISLTQSCLVLTPLYLALTIIKLSFCCCIKLLVLENISENFR